MPYPADWGCACPTLTTCLIGPTAHKYDATPTPANAAASAKAQKKWPVRSTTKPVATGARIPAKFATNSTKPVHVPANCFPANVCMIAGPCGLLNPKHALAANKRIKEGVEAEIPAEIRKRRLETIRPAHRKDFLTSVGDAPLAIQVSASQPDVIEDVAFSRKAAPPILAVVDSEK